MITKPAAPRAIPALAPALRPPLEEEEEDGEEAESESDVPLAAGTVVVPVGGMDLVVREVVMIGPVVEMDESDGKVVGDGVITDFDPTVPVGAREIEAPDGGL